MRLGNLQRWTEPARTNELVITVQQRAGEWTEQRRFASLQHMLDGCAAKLDNTLIHQNSPLHVDPQLNKTVCTGQDTDLHDLSIVFPKTNLFPFNSQSIHEKHSSFLGLAYWLLLHTFLEALHTFTICTSPYTPDYILYPPHLSPPSPSFIETNVSPLSYASGGQEAHPTPPTFLSFPLYHFTTLFPWDDWGACVVEPVTKWLTKTGLLCKR